MAQSDKKLNVIDPATVGSENTPGSLHMISAMGGVGLIAGILIVLTFQITLPIIKKNKSEYLEKSIFQVLPGATSKAVFEVTDENTLVAMQGEDDKAVKVYAGYDANKELVGVALEAQGQGFQDIIGVLYGLSPDKEAIIGMKVLESKETPGLGDKIEKDPVFVANFDSLDVSLDESGEKIRNPIVMVKAGTKTESWQIDAITGATISSRAIAKILAASTDKMVPIVTRSLHVIKAGASQ